MIIVYLANGYVEPVVLVIAGCVEIGTVDDAIGIVFVVDSWPCTVVSCLLNLVLVKSCFQVSEPLVGCTALPVPMINDDLSAPLFHDDLSPPHDDLSDHDEDFSPVHDDVSCEAVPLPLAKNDLSVYCSCGKNFIVHVSDVTLEPGAVIGGGGGPDGGVGVKVAVGTGNVEEVAPEDTKPEDDVEAEDEVDNFSGAKMALACSAMPEAACLMRSVNGNDESFAMWISASLIV